MRTRNLLKLAATALILISGTVAAQGTIVGSTHDLSGTNASDNGRVCVYCHTPHNTNGTTVPLWNRVMTSTTFTMYDSPTIDMTIAIGPQGTSLACLSCHDGTIALDQLYLDPFSSPNTAFVTGTALLGTSLADDHPVSVTYNPGLDTAFDTQTNAESDGIVFLGGTGDQVECASCHSVHDPSNVPFLRIANTGSALCVACHKK